MKQKRVSFIYKKKKISLNAFECVGNERMRGLTFRRRKNARALLFEFDELCREPIHSIFVFFPFVGVWLDGKRLVGIKTVKSFLPFIRPKRPFDRLIEIPLSDKYKKEVALIVGKERFKN